MAGKKSKKDEQVVSLDGARKRREVDELVAQINQLSKGMTDRVGKLVDAYHRWEAAHPDTAVHPIDKLEMIEHGFVGENGFRRCSEEHRLPGIALFGAQARFPAFGSEISEDIMCPALEHGTCEPVLEAFERPPCILLGAEVQQALAPRMLTSLADAALEDGWRESPEVEKKKFARAKKLVEKHQKLETAAEREERERK